MYNYKTYKDFSCQIEKILNSLMLKKYFNLVLIESQIPKNWQPYNCSDSKDIFEFNHECNEVYSGDYFVFDTDFEMFIFANIVLRNLESQIKSQFIDEHFIIYFSAWTVSKNQENNPYFNIWVYQKNEYSKEFCYPEDNFASKSMNFVEIIEF